MKKTITLLTILMLVVFMVGCENSINPVEPQTQNDNGRISLAKITNINVPSDYATIADAVAAALAGDVIHVGPGNYVGVALDKAVTIRGDDGTVIDGGPAHGSGLSQGFRLMGGSDGATLQNLTFTTDLSIMNGAAVNDVTITHCIFLNSVQAVSNWTGNGWTITHNKIIDLRTRCGGGIGIFVGDWSGNTANNNLVSHNKIYGILHVSEGDCGGYAGSGIVLYADFRGGSAGANEIRNNKVLRNKVSLTSDTPAVVPFWAFELTDSRDDDELGKATIYDNKIGFNDFRGSDNIIALTPSGLADVNTFSRNLGDDDNRGHGLHPRIFFE